MFDEPRGDVNAPQRLRKKEMLERIFAQVEQEKQSFISHWQDLSEFILPRRGRFQTTDRNRGDKRSRGILDSTASFALRTLKAGMMSGISSPSRPWFMLTTPDPDLAERDDVKEYLHVVQERMSTVFTKSNLYNKLPLLYGDLGVFGTGAMAAMECRKDVIRFYDFPVGMFGFANDAEYRVRTFTRQFSMTVEQLLERFKVGDDLSNFSRSVQDHVKNGQLQQWVDVRHVITPNAYHDPEILLSHAKRFTSCYYEKGGEQGVFLSEKGFDEFPILAARWEAGGEDVYATDSPGMLALPDIKQLQHTEKKLLRGIDKIVDPPMVGPAELKNARVSLLSGDITYVDVRQGMQGFVPAHAVDPRIFQVEEKQRQVRYRIQRAFYEDLFLMLANSPELDQPRTAREIVERHEEKLLALGPVLEQLNADVFDPLIDRAFNLMNRRGLLPPPPAVLEGVDLKVEYISIMAQAQKLLSSSGLERLAMFAERVVAITQDPGSVKKIDWPEAIEQFADSQGVAPQVLHSDAEMEEIEAAEAEAREMAQGVEMLQAGAKSARDLAASPTDPDVPGGKNALTDVLTGAAQEAA